MSENSLPDGFNVIHLSSGTRMWVGPDTLTEPMVVYAFPVDLDAWKATFTNGSGDSSCEKGMFETVDELEKAAAEWCGRVLAAGVSA